VVTGGATEVHLPDLPTVVSRVRMTRRVLATIAAEAAAAADGRETGGILLGSDDGTVVEVRRAGGPGPNADRRASGFRRDLTHAQELALAAWATDDSVWVGEWHTHPRGPARPSEIDLATYGGFLTDPALEFRRFCAIIVTPANGVDWRRVGVAAWLLTLDEVRAVPLQVG
jgi:integrative and conjugative element protein (TIGR02256 family)